MCMAMARTTGFKWVLFVSIMLMVYFSGTCALPSATTAYEKIVDHDYTTIDEAEAYASPQSQETISSEASASPKDLELIGKNDTPALLPGTASSTSAPKMNISIDHVEAQLLILQDLQEQVAQSIEQVYSQRQNGRKGKRTRASDKLRLELESVKSNLKQLADGLNGTLEDLEVVEKDTEEKNKQLEQVLQEKKDEEHEQYMEEHGIKEVDYETGRLRNTTGMTQEQLKKLEAVEKKSDPAVLHYDFELLGQIAVLLGVSAIGGIVATYFNIPPHIGYLFGGALVGPSCLGLVIQYEEVETISLFGSIFLLFGHGAAYTPQHQDLVTKKYFVGGFAYILSTVTLVAFVSVIVGWATSFLEGLIIGVGVSFTTTAPLREHIRANQMHELNYGKTVIAIIAVQDILMSFALGTPEWFAVRSVGWTLVAVFRSIVSYAVVASLAVCLHVYVVPRLMNFLVQMEQVHHAPLVLLGVVSVCLSLALVTEYTGLSLECGAFLAGLVFVNVSNTAQVAFTSIHVMENLFGSMFFASVGMILNPVFLIKNAGEILTMVILIIMIKTCSMTLVMTFFKVSIQRAFFAAFGLCQIGELALIFMIKAHATELVSRRVYLLFVAAVAVFLGCSSVFNRQLVVTRRKSVAKVAQAESEDGIIIHVATSDSPSGNRNRIHSRSHV